MPALVPMTAAAAGALLVPRRAPAAAPGGPQDWPLSSKELHTTVRSGRSRSRSMHQQTDRRHAAPSRQRQSDRLALQQAAWLCLMLLLGGSAAAAADALERPAQQQQRQPWLLQPAPVQPLAMALNQPARRDAGGGVPSSQHASTTRARLSLRRLAAADAAAWNTLNAPKATASGSAGNSGGGGDDARRRLLQENSREAAPGDEVVITSPNERINALAAQFFKVDFGGPTAVQNPLRLVAVTGADS